MVAEPGGIAVGVADAEVDEVVADADELELVVLGGEVEDEEVAVVEDVTTVHWPSRHL